MKKVVVLIIAVILCLSLVACSNGENANSEAVSEETENNESADDEGVEDETNDDEVAVQETFKIGLALPSYMDTSMVYTADKLTAAVEEYNSTNPEVVMELEVLSADDDATLQNTQILDLINNGADLICCMYVDSTLIWPSITAAQEAEVPFLALARDVAEGGPVQDYIIKSDNKTECYEVTKLMIEKMIEDGIAVEDINIIDVYGSVTDQNATDKDDGFLQALDEYGIEPIAVIESEWSADVLLPRISAALEEHPETNAIFCPTDGVYPAIETALTNLDKYVPYGEEGYIYCVSLQCGEPAIEAIREGYIIYDVLQGNASQGTIPVEVAKKLIAGEEVEYELFLPYTIVTSETIDQDEIDGVVNWYIDMTAMQEEE